MVITEICTNVQIFEKSAQNLHKICTKHRRFCNKMVQRLLELSTIEIDNYVFQNKSCVSVTSLFLQCALFGSTWASETRLFAKCADFRNVQILCRFLGNVQIFCSQIAPEPCTQVRAAQAGGQTKCGTL